jgi:hypothetical protein
MKASPLPQRYVCRFKADCSRALATPPHSFAFFLPAQNLWPRPEQLCFPACAESMGAHSQPNRGSRRLRGRRYPPGYRGRLASSLEGNLLASLGGQLAGLAAGSFLLARLKECIERWLPFAPALTAGRGGAEPLRPLLRGGLARGPALLRRPQHHTVRPLHPPPVEEVA